MHASGVVLSRLPKTRLFEGIGSKELREVVDAAETRKIGPRHVIIMAGEPAAHLFLILSGYAQFYRLSNEGEKVLLTRLAVGDVFGLGTLLSTQVRYIGTAETVRDSELLVWEHSRIRKLAETHPKLAENALGIILHYLATYADRLVNLVTLTAPERLAQVIFHLAENTGKIVPTGIEIEVTNEELSDLANVSTFTVSRLLSAWESRGALAKFRGKLFVYSPEKLLND
jgi:CRP-like cAMP-binding protein